MLMSNLRCPGDAQAFCDAESTGPTTVQHGLNVSFLLGFYLPM